MALSADEVAHFHERGYLPPFDLFAAEQMAALRPELERIFADEHGGHNSHQYASAVWELASRREIVGRMASLLGEDLSIWRTNFFVKEPAGSGSPLTREIPFHQDRNYWPLEPAVILSAWIAVTDSTPDGRSDFGSFGDTYCRSNQVSDASTYHCSYDNTHVPTHYSSGSCR